MADWNRPYPAAPAAPGVLADWAWGVPLADQPPVDHCYGGWVGVARLTGTSGTIAISASADARFLHVYTPAGEPYACLEPVTHRPDAVNGASGEMPVLAPGDTVSVRMRITADQS